jgi:hypothetical protein
VVNVKRFLGEGCVEEKEELWREEGRRSFMRGCRSEFTQGGISRYLDVTATATSSEFE